MDAAGLRIAFQRAGHGPSLVLLHGAYCDSSVWQPQMDGLSDEFTVLAWDAPGCGASDIPPDGFTGADYGRALAGFLAATGIKDPHVLGLSWGSCIALEFYRDHPDVPSSPLLASAYAGWAGSLSAQEVERRYHQILAELDQPPESFIPVWLPTLLTQPADPAVAAQVTGIMARSHPAGMRVMTEALAHTDYRGMLADIAVPTLLLYGENDVRSPLAVARELHRRIPGSVLETMPGVGHLSNLEAPEQFNAQVRRFLHTILQAP